IRYVLARWIKFEGQIIHGDATYDDNWPGFTDDAYLQIELQRSTIFLRGNGAFAGQLAATLSYISEMKRLCDERNIGFTVVLIPDEMQVSMPLQTRVIAESGRSSTSFDFALPNRLLRARLEQLEIDYIDLLTEFSADSLNERLYRPNDSHWNIAGNALAARLIWQHVSAQLGAVHRCPAQGKDLEKRRPFMVIGERYRRQKAALICRTAVAPTSAL